MGMGEDDDDDANADADDHAVGAPVYDDVGKYDDYDDKDVNVVACSCAGTRYGALVFMLHLRRSQYESLAFCELSDQKIQ